MSSPAEPAQSVDRPSGATAVRAGRHRQATRRRFRSPNCGCARGPEKVRSPPQLAGGVGLRHRHGRQAGRILAGSASLSTIRATEPLFAASTCKHSDLPVTRVARSPSWISNHWLNTAYQPGKPSLLSQHPQSSICLGASPCLRPPNSSGLPVCSSGSLPSVSRLAARSFDPGERHGKESSKIELSRQ